jgi:hypothetical protein
VFIVAIKKASVSWRVRMAAVLSLLLCGCGARPRETAGPAGQAVVCSESNWNFGTVDQARIQQLNHIFKVKNDSATAVHVKKVESSCGCIVSGDHPTAIAAGKTGRFPVQVRLTGSPGKFYKSVKVLLATSPPTHLTYTIQGMISVSPRVYTVPSRLDFGTVGAHENKTRTLKVSRYDGSPVRILRVIPRSKSVNVDYVERAEPEDAVSEVRITLDAAMLNPGEFQSSIAVLTVHEADRDLSIPLAARIEGRAHGLVESIFVAHLPKKGHVDKPLAANSLARAIVKDLDYEGDAPINVQLVGSRTADESVAVRISRLEKPCERKFVRGELVATLEGDDKPARIRLHVVLAE